MVLSELHEFHEGGGIGGLETEVLAGNGVAEAETEGVETEAADGGDVVLVAIHGVVDHGMLDVAQVDTYLIAAAGIEAELEEAVAARGFDYLVVGDGELAAIVGGGGEYAILSVGEPGPDGVLLGLYLAPGYGHIGAVVDDAFPVFLETARCLFVLAEDHETRGVAVEAMDDMGVATLVGVLEIGVEGREGGMVAGVLAVGEDALVLVDDDEILVFVDDVDAAVAETLAEIGLADGDDHSGDEGIVELGSAASVDAYAMAEDLLDAGAAQLGHAGQEEGEKLGVLPDDIFFVLHDVRLVYVSLSFS